jgi:hypothetical protein
MSASDNIHSWWARIQNISHYHRSNQVCYVFSCPQSSHEYVLTVILTSLHYVSLKSQFNPRICHANYSFPPSPVTVSDEVNVKKNVLLIN